MKGMFAHIKTQIEHPALPKSGFSIDHIMHLDIDFHKLELTRGSSYVELPEWIAAKKAVINNSGETNTFFQYLDANNLYGWVQKLPKHGFKWIEKVEEFTPEEIAKLAKKDNKGYVFEVEVDYPEELHKSHNELSFLPERMKIEKVEKLTPSLKKRKNMSFTSRC